MQILVLQFVVTFVSLVFGLTAIAVGRRIGEDRPWNRAGWLLAGGTFTLVNSVKLFQNVFGALAFASGPNTALWNRYLAWAPALDHSRTLALIACFILLFPIPQLLGRNSSGLRGFATPLWLVLGLLVGGVIGWQQEALSAVIHFRAVAVLDAVELLVVLASLFALLVRDAVDRLLWGALTVYAFNLALNVVWSSALMALESPGVWAPSPLYMQMYRVALMGTMAAFALRRFQLARRGVDISALFEPLRHNKAAVLR